MNQRTGPSDAGDARARAERDGTGTNGPRSPPLIMTRTVETNLPSFN